MIDNILFWNIRSINTQNSFERLMDMNRRFHYSSITLMESFQGPPHIEDYNIRLGFNHATINSSRKNWCFWKEEWDVVVVLDSIEQLTIRFKISNKTFLISSVYARCDVQERLELWEELQSVEPDNQTPWIIGGDYSVILNEEKNWED